MNSTHTLICGGRFRVSRFTKDWFFEKYGNNDKFEEQYDEDALPDEQGEYGLAQNGAPNENEEIDMLDFEEEDGQIDPNTFFNESLAPGIQVIPPVEEEAAETIEESTVVYSGNEGPTQVERNMTLKANKDEGEPNQKSSRSINVGRERSTLNRELIETLDIRPNRDIRKEEKVVPSRNESLLQVNGNVQELGASKVVSRDSDTLQAKKMDSFQPEPSPRKVNRNHFPKRSTVANPQIDHSQIQPSLPPSQPAKPQSKFGNCKKHKDKPLEVVCMTCSVIICSTCALFDRDHNSHRFRELNDVLSDISVRAVRWAFL